MPESTEFFGGRTLTYRKFLRVLRQTPRHWQLINGQIRSVSITYPFQHSPISAVYKLLTGFDNGLHQWPSTREKLGLDRSLALHIAEAEDNLPNHDPKIRRDLLRATGLESN